LSEECQCTLFTAYPALRQIHSLFLKEFSGKCELVLFSVSSILFHINTHLCAPLIFSRRCLSLNHTNTVIALKPFVCLFVFGATAPSGAKAPHSRGFWITHNDAPQSAGLLWTSDQLIFREFYLSTHNNHNRQTSMPPVGFEHTISAGERPHTHALNRTATGTGKTFSLLILNIIFLYRPMFFKVIYFL
jgi:hypothetical protein